MSSPLRLYGHFASQPFRAAMWLCKIKDLPVEMTKVEPLAGGTRTADFAARFPTAMVPALLDGGRDDFCVTEASAIMTYLCEREQWSDWYELGTDAAAQQRRARLNQYLSWHHGSTRLCTTAVMYSVFQTTFFDRPWDAEAVAKGARRVDGALRKLEAAFLSEGDFIGGREAASVADLMAHSEVEQLRMCELLDTSARPRIEAWSARMREVPHHDDVHRTARKVADMFLAKRAAA